MIPATNATIVTPLRIDNRGCPASRRAAIPGEEYPVKMKGREMRDACQRLQLEFLIEVAINVLKYAVHSSRVFGLIGSLAHGL
jgi:hypothetical protein